MVGRRRRRTSRRLVAVLGILPWATVAKAVALSDFTPKLTSLTSDCQDAYTTKIPGCKVNDFTNAAHTCSNSCLNGLVQINALVNQKCSIDDVEETSIIGLFLLGQAIQLLCNVAVVTTTTGVTGTGTGGLIPTNNPQSFSSTMTMVMTSPTTSAIVATTSSALQASVPLTSIFSSSSTSLQRPLPSASEGMIGNTPVAPPSSSKKPSSTSTKSPPSSTTLSPAAAESQRSGNVGSGGGSPFDNIDNSEAMSIRVFNSIFGGVFAAIALAAVMNLG